MTQHRSMETLQAGLADIQASPKDDGVLDLIVARTAPGQRKVLDTAELTASGGIPGDHWPETAHVRNPDGSASPDVQVTLMNSRCIERIAGPKENWPPAGDNLFVDFDLSPDNAPPGTRLAIGGAELEVTEEPHKGCAQFIERYGRDACVFVNVGDGATFKLRGIYAKIVKDGPVQPGDRVRKVR